MSQCCSLILSPSPSPSPKRPSLSSDYCVVVVVLVVVVVVVAVLRLLRLLRLWLLLWLLWLLLSSLCCCLAAPELPQRAAERAGACAGGPGTGVAGLLKTGCWVSFLWWQHWLLRVLL